jgi:Domain of unknown function (DUF4350)
MTPTDRKLLWGAGGLTFFLLVATIAFAPVPEDQGNPVPSSYLSGSGGALAAYLLLEDLHYPVRRWTESPESLPEDGVLILAEPTEEPTSPERMALEQFVKRGGRVLFCGPEIPKFFGDTELGERTSPRQWQTFSANLPSYVTRGAPKVVMDSRHLWGTLSATQLALYGEPGSAAVVAWRMGKGEILWWARATPLTNAGVKRAGNLNLFLNSVSNAGPIYWDEYFHGERGNLWTYVQKTPVVWGIGQLVILTAALIFTSGRRSGPLFAPQAVSRLSPLEFVDTMGGLYRRAGASSVPVGVSYRHVRLELCRKLGLPATVADADLAQAAQDRLGIPSGELREALEAAGVAQRLAKLPARQALTMVRKLEGYLAPLRAPNRRTTDRGTSFGA